MTSNSRAARRRSEREAKKLAKKMAKAVGKFKPDYEEVISIPGDPDEAARRILNTHPSRLTIPLVEDEEDVRGTGQSPG